MNSWKTQQEILVYDCETCRPVRCQGETPIIGLQYADSWQDYNGMGLAVIGVYHKTPEDVCGEFKTFLKDGFSRFTNLVRQVKERDGLIVGFNSVKFDDLLCQAHGITVETNYDLLFEVWRGLGLGWEFNRKTHGGRSLASLVRVNLGEANSEAKKSASGLQATLWWQRGEYEKVISYCLQDVLLTKELLKLVDRTGSLKDPKKVANIPMAPLSSMEYPRKW